MALTMMAPAPSQLSHRATQQFVWAPGSTPVCPDSIFLFPFFWNTSKEKERREEHSAEKERKAEKQGKETGQSRITEEQNREAEQRNRAEKQTEKQSQEQS